MQLTRPLHAGTLAGLALSLTAGASGALPSVDEQEAAYLFRYFADSDHVHVWSHYGSYDIALVQGATFDVQWNNERVVIPAVDAPVGSSEAVDAITTASRPISDPGEAYEDFVKSRNEVTSSIGYRGLAVAYYVSTEFDYFAQQLGASANRALLDENLNVSVGTSYGWDRIDPASDEDTSTPADSKTTWHADVVATGVLSPTTLLRVGAETNLVRGLQHSPYRNVYAGGGNVPEAHPDERTRHDFFVKLSQYFHNRSSARVSYRHYRDDWGIVSNAYDARLHQYVGEDVVVRYRYRYYTQTAADFYRPEYDDENGVDGFLTGDYRLAPLSAHLLGSRLGMSLGTFVSRRSFLDNVRLSFSYERYFNSNNFSANVFETGLTVAF